MASQDSLMVRNLLKKGVVRQNINDEAIAVRMRYIGTGSVTSVTVVQATSVVNITSDGGTDTYLFSNYSTLGALVDAINADGIFEAIVIDALRSENPDDFFIEEEVSAGTDENGIICYDLLTDTSAAATAACCLSPISPNFDMPKGHRVHLRQISYTVDNTASTDTLKIYKRKGTVETLIYSAANTDNSATDLTFASGEGKITAGIDEELIVFFDGTVTAVAIIALIGELE